MPEFFVTYDVELEAADHEDAARTVAGWMRDPECSGPVLSVLNCKGPGIRKEIDTDKVPSGVWKAFAADGDYIGAFSDFADAKDAVTEHGTIRFVRKQ